MADQGLKFVISADIRDAVAAIGTVSDATQELATTGVGNLQSVSTALTELRAAAQGAGNTQELATFNKEEK